MIKKVQVVMLPTNEKANALWWSGQKLYIKPPEDPSRGELNHLYFLSDETIKEGDWYYVPRTNSVYKCIECPIELNLEKRVGIRKVITTTDSSLKQVINDVELGRDFIIPALPQPSQDFIKVFVEEYNKGNVIEWVDVECEEY